MILQTSDDIYFNKFEINEDIEKIIKKKGYGYKDGMDKNIPTAPDNSMEYFYMYVKWAKLDREAQTCLHGTYVNNRPYSIRDALDNFNLEYEDFIKEQRLLNIESRITKLEGLNND